MLLQCMLHVLERVAQLQKLVFRLDLRQWSFKVSIGYADGGIGKLSQWLDQSVDGYSTPYEQRYRSHDKDNYSVHDNTPA